MSVDISNDMRLPHRGRSTDKARHWFKYRWEPFEKRILSSKSLTDEQRKLALWTGFSPDKQRLYDFDTYNPALFLTDVEREITHHINGQYSVVLKNKILSYQVLSHYVRVPRLLAAFADGKCFFQAPDAQAVVKSAEGLIVFAKPTISAGGAGAEKFRVREGIVMDGPNAGQSYEDRIKTLVKMDPSLVVMEALEQHPEMDQLFEKSINTVRVLTVRDPDAGEPKAVRSLVRVGNEKSAPVDNFSAGGYSFHVDVDSGVIGNGASKSFNRGASEWVEEHPDTGNRITGKSIPMFDKVKRTCELAHRNMPYIHYIGWDICVGPDELFVVEANNTTDVDLFQMHEPFLLSDTLRRFYRAHHVL